MNKKELNKERLIHILTVITGLYIAYYIYWRIAFTINTQAVFFSVVLVVAEIQGVINFLLFSMMTWNLKKEKTPEPILDAKVDIFIPTYNEDLTVLEATITGSNNVKLTHTTYVLDDGKRKEVEQLAKSMGCEYLTREDNKHAKAGNINAALKKTDGEFIVVLDADMVPQPEILEKTLGYFREEKVAIVQLPQEFYNLDSMQHQKDGMNWHEQQLFYHVIQPGKDNINAAFWCGSPSVVRRAALEEIGGVATDSITEDFLTSIRLNSQGWKIRYHEEALAFGIAPQSFDAFSVQRLRWAQGSMKILRSKDNPLIIKGLGLKQRFSHFAAIFTYFDAYQKLIYLLTPAILLFTGIMPIKVISPEDFFLHWLPYFVLTMITNTVLGRGYFAYIEVEKFNTLKMITFIKASFSLVFGKNMKFKVTPKAMEQSVKQKDKKELTFHIVILTIIIASMTFATVNAILNQIVKYPSVAAMVIALFWSVINGGILYISLHEVLKRAYFRRDYRFPLSIKVGVEMDNGKNAMCTVSNISRGGLSLICAEEGGYAPFNGDEIVVKMKFEGSDVNVPSKIVYSKMSKNNTKSLGVRFNELDQETKKKLYKFLYVTAPRMIYEENAVKSKKKKRGFKLRLKRS